MSEGFDLLGDPIPEGLGKRGRPPHLVTDEKRLKVRVLLAFSDDEAAVADGLGISVPTLRKHYFRELREKLGARKRLKATLLFTLAKEAEAGNASAIDKLFKRLDKLEVAEMAEVIKSVGGKGPAKGKKELQREVASNATGLYAPPAGPSSKPN
jgi:hypothetical protein